MNDLIAKFEEECFRDFDRMTADEFAIEFVEADNESRVMFQLYLGQAAEERKNQIRERIAYYSSEVGNAQLAVS